MVPGRRISRDMDPRIEQDVVIVGGGLAGPLCALALARAGLTSLVLDARPRPAPSPDFDGRAYALALGSVRMLRALDLWDGLVAEPIRGIRASDGRAGKGAGPFVLSLDAAEIGEASVGHMVEDRHLRARLLDACDAEPGVTMRFDAPVTDQRVANGFAEVTTSDATHRARLLIGADGRGSGVAERAGIRRQVTDYRQTALVCAIAHDRPHGGLAHQFFMPPGPLAILPLTGNRSSLVWTETPEEAAALSALPPEAYLEALRPRFGSFLGQIALVGQRATFPLTLNLAQRVAEARLVLVADAAHGIHPIAGQGLNLGFKDIAALADVLAAAGRRGEDPGAADVTERYARWRRFDTGAMGLFTDLTNRVFSTDDPALRLARGLGIGAVQALPGLRRRIIREAAGLTGDLPGLMRAGPR